MRSSPSPRLSPPHAWSPLFCPTPVSFVGPLRGGAQAQRLRCSDGHDWAVKYLSNPQGRRILANEWIASAVAGYLGINTPELSPVWIDSDFIAENNLSIAYGTRRELIPPGYHLGSRWAATGNQNTYDYLPSSLLARVANRRDFIGALILGKLLHNADSQQCVFTSADGVFKATFIDFGYCFNGTNWEADSSELCGLYFAADAYQDLQSPADFQPWLAKLAEMPLRLLTDAVDTMPPAWLQPSDRPALTTLLKTIYTSRLALPALIESLCNKRSTHFPQWHRSQQQPMPIALAA